MRGLLAALPSVSLLVRLERDSLQRLRDLQAAEAFILKVRLFHARREAYEAEHDYTDGESQEQEAAPDCLDRQTGEG